MFSASPPNLSFHLMFLECRDMFYPGSTKVVFLDPVSEVSFLPRLTSKILTLYLEVTLNFPQWTGSDKLRRVTGWSDHRPLFTEALHVYRLAYEAAQAAGNENIRKTISFLQAVKSEMG